MTNPIIWCQDLSRDFTVPLERGQSLWRTLLGATRTVQAVRGVSFAVQGGERVALLGKNGSGKSTLVKMLTGVIAPSSGQAKVLGATPSPHNHAYLRRIGVMFGQKSLLFPDLTVMDALQLYRVIYDLSETAFQQSLSELDDYLQVGRLLKRQARKLSLGERMRCEVVAALIHRPDVIFLDEPTIGMDGETRHGLARYLEQRIGPDQTLVLTTHEYGLVQGLCSRALVMADGALTHDVDLKQASLRGRVRIEARFRRVNQPDLLSELLASVRTVERKHTSLVIECEAPEEERVKRQIAQALDLVGLQVGEAPIDAILESLMASPVQQAVGGLAR